MRPSQYHYIKRAVTRTAYNRKMQKKRAKKRKKELRKKKRKERIYTFQKNSEKASVQHDSPGFKITMLVLAEIFFGILTLFQTINLFANWTRCMKENGNWYYILIHNKYSIFWRVNISILIFDKKRQEKRH